MTPPKRTRGAKISTGLTAKIPATESSPSEGGHPVTLRAHVDASVAAMGWLKPSDAATVALARMYADRIDAAVQDGDDAEATKALYLGPHLLHALRALGGAPAERKALGAEEAVNGKLAQLRALRGGAA